MAWITSSLPLSKRSTTTSRRRPADDFAESISDRAAGQSLSRALDGKGAFRRFRNELYQRHPKLISVWQSFRDARARGRAVGWLVEQGMVEEEAAQRFADDLQEPALP